MKKQSFIPFSVLFLIFLPCTLISAQAPAAAPAPPGPTDITTILNKDGRFAIFTRLLQTTKVLDNLNSQLNDSNSGITIFAPTDAAFSILKTGMLNSFTDEKKTELVQFHILPSYLPPSQFQTASNPLRTQAGSSKELFAMNVTMPPPPPPPLPKKPAPKAKPAFVESVDSSGVKCRCKLVLSVMACFMLALAAFP